MMKPHLLFILVLTPAVSICMAQQAPFPEIIVVNTTFDATSGADDAFPGDGQCETAVGNGVCTVRAAIEESNAHGGTDGIFFDIPTSDPGYSNGTWTINVTKALPDISDGANVNGPGSDKLVVQHATGYGPFRLFNVTATGTTNLSGMTIAHAQNPNDGNLGSGIRNFNSGTLNITKCAFVDNYLTAIHNANGGTMNITGCTITGGNTGSNGGGINNNAWLTVKNTTINNNLAANGGAVWSNGYATLIGCTISGNIASFDSTSKGGGLYNEITTGHMDIVNCTVNGNTSSGDAGGIYDGNKMNITNSTVSGNSSGQQFAFGGAAISIGPYGGTYLNIKSTIVAVNTSARPNSYSPDVFGPFTSAGFNLIGATDGSTGFTASTDLTGTLAAPLNPKLGPLKYNGGPTDTMALLSGSPAIDKGSSAGLTGTLTTDQRGVGYKRTINKPIANATGGDGADIGAFELGAKLNVVSSKTHGSAGTFKVNLPAVGKVGVECRSGGASGVFKVVFTFPTNVTVSDVSVMPDPKAPGSIGGASSFSVSGSTVTVNLTGVSNAQTLTITLLSVSDGTNTNDVTVPMGVLLGDVNSTRKVDTNDVSVTQSKVGQALTKSNFREDVNVDGAINSMDVNLVQSKVGTFLP